MAGFGSKPLNQTAIGSRIKRQPFLMFGLPFLSVMIAASFGLGSLTQTRYDLRDEKVHAITKEEELHMKQGRKKFDVREEYFRLQMDKVELDEFENKRVERLPNEDSYKDTGREIEFVPKVE